MKLHSLEIGTSDFKIFKPENDEQIIMYVEPHQFYLDRLPDGDNIIKINCAISDKCDIVPIFYTPLEIIEKYNLPIWMRGTSSLYKPHPAVVVVQNHPDNKPFNFPNLSESYDVKVITFQKLIEDNGITSINILKIDTEGHDTIIINSFLDYVKNNRYELLPRTLIFEDNYLISEKDKNKLKDRLKSFGYQIMYNIEEECHLVLFKRPKNR